MLKEIHNDSHFNQVFTRGESATQNVTISDKGNSRSYILLGYPMQPQDHSNSKYSGVFIYQDLKSIEDTNNAITIIILITAIIFLATSTVFAFFYQIKLLNLYDNCELKHLTYQKGIILKRQPSQLKTKSENYHALLIT